MSDFFNLEIGDYYIRLLVADLNNKLIKISNLGLLEEKNDFLAIDNNQILDEEVKKIKELVNKMNIKNKEVNIIIPDNYSYSQVITMPYLKEKELYSAIKYQADQFIPLAIDEATIDLDILYEDKKNNQLIILIVAASNNLINRLVLLSEKIGLIPQTIENQISCFSRLITYWGQYKKINEPVIFLNFDYYSSTLYFYNPAINLITNIFNFNTGLNIFIKEISLNYNFSFLKAAEVLKTTDLTKNNSINIKDVISPAFKELIDNIYRFILSATEKNNSLKIKALYLFNLNKSFFDLEKNLESVLKIPVYAFDPSDLIEKNNFYSIFNQNKSAFISLLGSIL